MILDHESGRSGGYGVQYSANEVYGGLISNGY